MRAHKGKGYGCTIMTNGDDGGIILDVLKDRIDNAYGYDSLDRHVIR